MMKKAKKYLITTVKREIFIVRQNGHRAIRRFCAECVGEAEMLTLDEAVSVSGIVAVEIARRVETGVSHFEAAEDGNLFICSASLLKEKNQTTVTKKNLPKWNLTARAFDKLLLCLDGKREQAGEKYLLLRRNLVRFFEGRRCAEAEEAADEVCNRLARKLDAGELIENISQYAYGVARLLILELYKRRNCEQKALRELPQEETEISQAGTDDTESRLESLHHCLNDLSAENRELILTYYKGDGREKIKNRQALADKLGIPLTALRNRAVRLRDKLEMLLTKNLKGQPF